MKTITEEDDYNDEDSENVNPEDNAYHNSSAHVQSEDPSTFVAAVSGGIPAEHQAANKAMTLVS